MPRALNLTSLNHDLETGRFEAVFTDNSTTIIVQGGGGGHPPADATVSDRRKVCLRSVEDIAQDLLGRLPAIQASR